MFVGEFRKAGKGVVALHGALLGEVLPLSGDKIMHFIHRHLMTAATTLACALVPIVSLAQDDYPSRPITLIIPFPPGGTADGFTRPLAQALGKRLGQPVVVENRPGANGSIGTTAASQKPADGYTILYGTAGTLVVNPYLYPDISYDTERDFQPVTITHQMPNVLVVGSDTPYKTVGDVIAEAKAHPDRLSYASAGVGNSMHLAAEGFLAATGTKMVHVPYKGGADAVNDILGGRVPLMFNNLPAIVKLVTSGKMRALAVADTKRSPLLPDVPTMAEAGVPGFNDMVWAGLLVHKNTDTRIVNKLSTEIRAVLQDPEFSSPQKAIGYEIVGSTPEAFARQLKHDKENIGTLLTRIGLRK